MRSSQRFHLLLLQLSVDQLGPDLIQRLANGTGDLSQTLPQLRSLVGPQLVRARRGGGHPLALREVRCTSSVCRLCRNQTSRFTSHWLICTQVAEALAKRPDAPKCVVAARPELETGAAARLLREWAGDARNVVVLTARPGAPLGAAR